MTYNNYARQLASCNSLKTSTISPTTGQEDASDQFRRWRAIEMLTRVYVDGQRHEIRAHLEVGPPIRVFPFEITALRIGQIASKLAMEGSIFRLCGYGTKQVAQFR